jgi:hypothetical protein
VIRLLAAILAVVFGLAVLLWGAGLQSLQGLPTPIPTVGGALLALGGIIWLVSEVIGGWANLRKKPRHPATPVSWQDRLTGRR